MNEFYLDILAQPSALRDLVEFYRREGKSILSSIPRPLIPILTGMGASFHAVWIAAAHLHRFGIPAVSLEATDLLHAGEALLTTERMLVYVSQSGASAEVAPILENGRGTTLIGLANDMSSPLARRANWSLPLCAGRETFVACKTYVNSLAALWLLCQHWGVGSQDGDLDVVSRVAERIDRLLAESNSLAGRWLAMLKPGAPLVFLGQGPHAATARQAAMMCSEWAKIPARAFSTGAFRHGFIESVNEQLGVVVFAAPGPYFAAARRLANELSSYGAQVLLVSNGETHSPDEELDEVFGWDEFLSPMLDIVPAQLFAEALARELGVPPGFRYIRKVVTEL